MSGPLPGVLAPLTVPASMLYRLAVNARNARFDRGASVVTLDRPVISVGNLTTGGVGKTPMVMWIVELLRSHDYRPVIGMRGYGARYGERSDEEAEYLDRLGDVPVVAEPDRAAALSTFLADHREVDCVVLDDGFQHRRIARQLDLVLIDASRRTFSDRLLPAGHMREPIANLQRADAVVVTRAESVDHSLSAQIDQNLGQPPVAWSRHLWSHLDLWTAGGSAGVETGWLAGKRVLTMLGVGHPGSIVRQVQGAGAEVAVDVPVSDHQHYDSAQLSAARSRCDRLDAMVTTAKDWVKIRRVIDLERWPVPVVVPRLVIEVFDGQDRLRDLVLAAVTAPKRRDDKQVGSSGGT